MSTTGRTTICLEDSQKKVFEGIRKALEEENGTLTQGEALEEISRAYPVLRVLAGGGEPIPANKNRGMPYECPECGEMNGDADGCELPTLCAVVEETAAEVGDPMFTVEQMESFDSDIKRNMAKVARSDTINGRSTDLQITAYFACPRAKDMSGYPE